MKSRQWDKLTTDKLKIECNDWCCPCNDGSTGCYANKHYSILCDNSCFNFLDYHVEDGFRELVEESYWKMVEGYKNPEVYEEFCEKFVKELENENF